jgi:hypothetical protein
VSVATVLVAQALYRERTGWIDASYTELATGAGTVLDLAGMSGQVNRMLAVPRPTVA